MPSYPLTSPAVAAFVVIPLALVALLGWGVHAAWRRAGASASQARFAAIAVLTGAALWLALTWIVAQRGMLTDFTSTPPPFAFLVFGVIVIAIGLAWSRVGTRLATYLPLWVLVAVQSFRLPLEIAMHGMYERGIMPVQMTYTGRNFDILTGLSAIIVASLLASGRAGRRLVVAWNVLGLALLTNVVVIAILSTPRFAYFGSEHLNIFVLHPPFVWLPALMVLAAFAGHLIIFRTL